MGDRAGKHENHHGGAIRSGGASVAADWAFAAVEGWWRARVSASFKGDVSWCTGSRLGSAFSPHLWDGRNGEFGIRSMRPRSSLRHGVERRERHQFGRPAWECGKLRLCDQQRRAGGGRLVVGGAAYATEWSGGNAINLGGLPGYTESGANSISNVGQIVGASVVGGVGIATEWSGGSVINLGGLPGYTESSASGVEDSVGQIVGYSVVGGVAYATEWSGSSVIDLEGLPGSTKNVALGVNNSGQVVGVSVVGGLQYAVEWTGEGTVNLGGLAGFTDSVVASSINDAGQAVGWAFEDGAVEWSAGSVISLGSLPNSIGTAVSINNSGWVVGYSSGLNFYATEWNGGSIVDLGTLPGFAGSFANGVNGTGQVVGWSFGVGPPRPRTLDMDNDASRLRQLGAGRLSLAHDLIGRQARFHSSTRSPPRSHRLHCQPNRARQSWRVGRPRGAPACPDMRISC